MDCQPCTKKGHPPHSTTGVAIASSIHDKSCVEIQRFNGQPGKYPPMATISSGVVSTRLNQNRRRISLSSGFSSSSAPAVFGSSAMPQRGQVPGSLRTISGCMGQVYSVFEEDGIGETCSKAIPHFGHVPGLACRTSGCIGQVYSGPFWAVCEVGFTAIPECSGEFNACAYFEGSARNFSRHFDPQKRYCCPSYSWLPAADSGFTLMPQTGSVAGVAV